MKDLTNLFKNNNQTLNFGGLKPHKSAESLKQKLRGNLACVLIRQRPAS